MKIVILNEAQRKNVETRHASSLHSEPPCTNTGVCTRGFLAALGMTVVVLLYIGIFLFIPLLGGVRGGFSFAQQNSMTVGFQVKPIFRGEFFSARDIEKTQDSVNFTVATRLGFSGGMIIRKGITKNLSFETGINYVKRVYNLSITDSSFTGESKFRIIGYEIPILALIYIRIGEKFYMDNAAGLLIDMFPSDIFTSDSYFKHSSRRTSFINPALLANLGWEYRTDKSGFFYIGASYHRPFSKIMLTKIRYIDDNNKTTEVETKLAGSYLTIDFRYFFPETPKQ